MRLLSLNENNELAWAVFGPNQIPPYAILSHTWHEEEVSYYDLVNGSSWARAGYRKILFCGVQAKRDGLHYFWVDTCCIDKSSSAELSEAINSMFRWYRDAIHCYVYLEDVSLPSDLPEDWVAVHQKSTPIDTGQESSQESWKADFRKARWFTRGWTLQELIAPKLVSFFSQEGQRLGDKHSLEDLIHEISGIDGRVLQGSGLSNYTVEERFSWAEGRQTTRIEDGAYCLLGIFDIHMPLLYGEGDKAFRRLAEEIVKSMDGYRPITVRDVLRLKAASSGKGIAHTKRLLADLALEKTHEGENANETNNTRGTSDRKGISEGREGGNTNKSAGKKTLASSPSVPPRDHNDEEQDGRGHQDGDGPDDRPLTFQPSSRLTDHQLRIITLEGGIIGDRLVGYMQTYNFSNAPTYYALSYAWGDEPDLHPISLNGTTKFIRSNLFHALQRIRLRSGRIHIWIDSICIRQEDEMEKKSQVRQMAQIYKNATGVMVWLGEKDSTSNLALDLITKIVKPQYSWKGEWWLDYGFVALAQLLERAWFRRRWVLQEAAMSNNTTIYCGDRQVYMSLFSDAVNLVRAKLSRATPIDIQMSQSSPFAFLANFRDSPAVRLLDIIETVFRRTNLPLETLVNLARFSDTSDHRDTIYSLLSLARDVSLPLLPPLSPHLARIIEPDYSKTVLDVYAEFVEHCIHHTGSLDIICRPWAPSSSRHPTHVTTVATSYGQSLPSWIATRDRLPFGDPSLRLTHRQHGKVLVDASSKRVYNCHFNSKPIAQLGRNLEHKCSGSLHVQGFTLGKIAKTSMRMASSMMPKDCLQLLASSVQNASQGPFSIPDVIWRTMCADRDDRGDPAPTFYRSAMSHLLQLSSEMIEESDQAKQIDLLDNVSSIDVEELLNTDLHDHVRTYLEIVRDVIWNRKTFRASPESAFEHLPLVGLAPQAAKVGDRVCLLYGCSVPVVLRGQIAPDGGDYWQLIGEAYVDSIMDGEIIEACEPSSLKSQEEKFELR